VQLLMMDVYMDFRNAESGHTLIGAKINLEA
jgi:hypothetical protein